MEIRFCPNCDSLLRLKKKLNGSNYFYCKKCDNYKDQKSSMKKSSSYNERTHKSEGCPWIALKNYRSNKLLFFLDNILDSKSYVYLEEIYNLVLDHFGFDICEPQTFCGNTSNFASEYKHTIRWTLDDGKRKKIFFSNGKGGWTKY